jgi:hypothetical protein
MREPSIDLDPRTSMSIGGLLGALRFALPLLGGLIALIAIPAALSVWLQLDFDSMYWIALGLTLAGLTLTRPWWFWYEPRAQFVQRFLGERGTMVAYLFVALIGVLIGAQRQIAITTARQYCTTALASAKNSHERFRVLYQRGADGLPHSHYVRQSFTCEQLLEP